MKIHLEMWIQERPREYRAPNCRRNEAQSDAIELLEVSLVLTRSQVVTVLRAKVTKTQLAGSHCLKSILETEKLN